MPAKVEVYFKRPVKVEVLLKSMCALKVSQGWLMLSKHFSASCTDDTCNTVLEASVSYAQKQLSCVC